MAELPSGYREVPEEDRKKAQVFFGHGRAVAATGNYDYAINMFLDGLRLDPDDMNALQELREISLKRKAGGGKALGMFEAMKLKKTTKDEKENLISAHRLLAFDPGNGAHMVNVAQRAATAGYYDTVVWAGLMAAEAEASGGKPDVNFYLTLRDVFVKIENWKLALECLNVATRLKPLDMDLQVEARNAAARMTMGTAGYDKAGSFRDQVRDMKSQLKLLDSDKEVNDADLLGKQIADAEKELAADPNEPGKVSRLVDVLTKIENAKNEERAVKLLQEWFDKTKQFRFRQRIGEIRMKQMHRQERAMRKALTSDPAVRKNYEDFQRKQAEFELSEFSLCASAYPTVLSYRFEMGKRQLILGHFDESISSFQQARNDPKQRVESQIMLSQAFYRSGFLDEADETLAALIRDYPNRENQRFMDMNYLRGLVLEKKGQIEEAIKHYSTVFQIDSTYKDVGARIKKLKALLAAPPPEEKTEEE